MADAARPPPTLTVANTDGAHGRPAPDVGMTMRIGRYLVRGLLGCGGMGVVYLGYDEQLQRRVAIKRINRSGGDELSRQRSLREGLALARLAHPNIVAVYEAIEVDDQLCIVMEFVAGETLRDWLRETRPALDERLAVLIQAGRGIAAAHAAGLVHRDLKPDNIMIGHDGRVRVMDFGLARAVDGRQEPPEFEAAGSSPITLSPSATYTGAFVGTPGYVSPEQHLGVTADARSDVFSFCVLAFEALHGQRPFSGGDDEASFAAMQAGRVEDVPDGEVPRWLDAVIRRGLAASPDARWPSMDALLAALADDPLARTRRRWRAFAWFGLAGLVAAGLTYAASLWFEAVEQSRREEAAAARLGAVELTITRTGAEGDPATAEAAFRAFIADPENRHTRALARAWLDHGDRREADARTARAAYAEAYVHARTIDDERTALRRLAATFARDLDGVGLGRTVDLLRGRGADDPALTDHALHAALWQGDLPAAAAELARAGHAGAAWRPALEHLARATASPMTARRAVRLPGEPVRFAVRDHLRAHVVLMDAGLHELGRWRAEGRIDLVPGTSWALAQTAHEGRVVDLLTGAVLDRGPADIATVVPFDVTGDGVPELFFGQVWPRYGFQRWDGVGRGESSQRDAHPGTDAGNSVFEADAVGDLDGDGRDELVIGFGPWSRFDLRVFRPDAHGELELVVERRLGRIGGLALVRHGARRLLAALVDDSCPAPDVFPEPPHVGGPPGLHLFELQGGALVEAGFVPFPHGDAFTGFAAHDREVVGDLDGDGRDDLAFPLTRHGAPWLLLLRQTETSFEPLLARIELLAGAQLDDDAPLELLTAGGPEHGLLALGLGDTPAPGPAPGAPIAPPLPGPLLADPWLALRWNRASDLAALSLVDSAAESLRDAALMIADRPSKSALLDRAGELFAGRQRALDVLTLEHDVHDDSEVRGRAELRRVQALSHLGRHEEAYAEAEALLREPIRDAESVRVASALAADLSALLAPDAQIDLRFDVPLGPQWTIHTVGALHRKPTRGVLEFESPAIGAPMAELPIDWKGGPISLEFELDVERLEFGAGLEISLADAGGRRWLAVAVSGEGGGGRLQQVLWAKAGFTGHAQLEELQVPSGFHRRRIAARLTYFPGAKAANLMLAKDDDVQFVRLNVVEPPGPGLHRLVIGGLVNSMVSSLATGELRRIVVRGARLADASVDGARDRAARLLAEHEPRAALAAAGEGAPPHAEAVRLLALAELGQLDGLTESARVVLAHADDPQRRGELVLALRRHPLAAAALRDAAGTALLPILRSIWGFAPSHRNDLLLRDELQAGLRDLERMTPTTDAETDALCELLETRARLWQHGGQPERARQDLETAAALPCPRTE